MKRPELSQSDAPRGVAGFTLVEVLVGMLIMTIGLLSLAQVFVVGIRQMNVSRDHIIAREKAREAVESVHTARDTHIYTWNQIRNVSQGGVFLDGPRRLRAPAPGTPPPANWDGLVNTRDDPALPFEEIWEAGPDNLLGNADDVRIQLNGFTREIRILDVPNIATLRRLLVVVRYQAGGRGLPATCLDANLQPVVQPGCYVLATFVSQFS